MRRLAWFLLLGFAFATPWEYSLDFGAPVGNIARTTGLLLLLASVPAVLLTGRVRTPGPVQWLAVTFFVWFCCSLLWTIEAHATVVRLRGYFQVMLPVWLVWEFAETPEDMRDLLRACILGSWVLAALTFADLASPEIGQIRFVAEGQDPNDVARFLDLSFPLSALLLDAESSWLGRVLAIGYLPVGLAGVVLTASRGGFLAALVALGGCGFLLARRHKRALLAVALSVAAMAGSFWFLVPRETMARIGTIPEQIQHGDLNHRLNIWQAGWQACHHAPFFGTGAGTFVDAARLAPADTAHNTALAVAVEGGVIALILAAAIVAVCARSVLATTGAVRIAMGTALLVWVVTSLVATVEESRATWMLLGLIALAGRLSTDQPKALERCFPDRTGAMA